jgi:hypothetical protein
MGDSAYSTYTCSHQDPPDGKGLMHLSSLSLLKQIKPDTSNNQAITPFRNTRGTGLQSPCAAFANELEEQLCAHHSSAHP